MIKLQSNGSYVLKNRGKVYLFDKLPDELYDPKQFMYKVVMIDEVVRDVRGVERYAIAECTPQHPYALSFRLLI